MKWYTFNDEGETASTVNMILDHNTTSTVSSWSKSKTQITTDTSTWDSSLNARLITANEVAKITGNTSFDASKTGQNYFYFDSNNQTQTAKGQGASKYAWLFDYTDNCTSYGCNIADSSTRGYWTSSAVAGRSSFVWCVYSYGILGYVYDDDTTGNGVRPVITVSKAIIQ